MSQTLTLSPERQAQAVGALAAAGAVALTAAAGLGAVRAPDLALIAAQPIAIRLHLGAAVVAFALGAILLLGPKGRLPHRLLGWTWVAAMAVTAMSSLFIRNINPGAFSAIHLLSGWAIVTLPFAVYAARRRNVKAHRSAMTSLYLGGMLVAGSFAFMPGRLLWQVFVG